MRRLIRISTRAIGERRWVRVYIYDDLEEMRAESTRFKRQRQLRSTRRHTGVPNATTESLSS